MDPWRSHRSKLVCKETASIRSNSCAPFFSPPLAWSRPTIAFRGHICPHLWHRPFSRLPLDFFGEITYGTIYIYLNMAMLPVQLTRLSLSQRSARRAVLLANSDLVLIQPASTDPISCGHSTSPTFPPLPHAHTPPPHNTPLSLHPPQRVRQPILLCSPLSAAGPRCLHHALATTHLYVSTFPPVTNHTNHRYKNNPEKK